MFQFQDVQIPSSSISINGRKELVFRTKIKREDYSMEDFEKMAEMADTMSFCMVMVPFQEEIVQDPLPKLRQSLALTIKEYCETGGYKEEDEVNAIYKRNNVKSRGDLNVGQIHIEIEKYRAGVSQFKN